MYKHVLLAAFVASIASAQGGSSATKPLRDMSTDRPDKTESPYTVDRGHVQTETDLVTWTRDRAAGVTVQSWSAMPTNVKIGLTDRVDLQIVAEPWTGERVRTSKTTKTSRSFGTVTARVKVNFWGNDGGRTAFGVMPFITTTPSDAHRAAEGGVIIPLGIALGHGWDLGTMIEGDIVTNEDGRSHHSALVSSVTTSHGITERTGFYVELFNEASRQPGVTTFDAGTTFGMTPNVQFDAGVNVGISRAADGVNPFVGISIRF